MQLHAAALGGIFVGVRHDVQHRLLQFSAVSPHPQDAVRRGHPGWLTFARRFEAGDRQVHHLVERELFDHKVLATARLDAGQVEQFVDDGRHQFGLAVDGANHLAPNVRVKVGVEQQLGITIDAGHRRAQFVGGG